MRDRHGRPVVAVTGYGMISSLGQGVKDSWAGLVAGRSGVKRISRFATDNMRTTIAGAIDYLWRDDDTAMDITMRAGILAAEEAIADAGIGTPGDFPGPMFAALPPAELEWPYRRTLYDGAPQVDGDGYDRMIAAARRRNDDYGFRHALLGFIGEGIAEKLGTRGAPISLTTACASGATSIQLGVEAIRRGDTDAAISLGADCSVNPEMMIRFGLLSALSGTNDPPENVSRPFDKERDGFVIAEGAAALVLENYDAAVARGAKIHAIVEGIGEKADDFHRTRSKPDGSAVIGALKVTLDDAGVSPDTVDYVNAHGTGTPENDRMEAMSLEAVFGERMRRVPISSNKSMIGHTLTAAGAIEAIFSIRTMEEGVIPPTINYHNPDPAIPFDVVPNTARAAKVGRVLSNSFGFGGQNACLVLAAEPAETKPALTMRALQLLDNRSLALVDIPDAPAPGPGEVTVQVGAVALNHIDVWGWRGMAFAKRTLPIVVGAEAAGTVVAVGPGVSLKPGQVVAFFGAETCGKCKACLAGRDNFCDNVAGIRGFHVDGLARERVTLPARLVVPAPEGVSVVAAACAPITFGTVEHMLFDNARLENGQTVLVQAGGSGIGTAAIQLAKAVGATVITTVSTEAKAAKAKALGADHVINYKDDRFENIVRKLTKKEGVDVVFEHVGPDTFARSMFCLKRGGILVTCGSTTGVSTEVNLFQLYQRQLRLIGSFGCNMRNLATVLDKMAAGIAKPVIDTTIGIDEIDRALARLESRDVFGKIVVTL